jgi:hypothetical protein
MHRRSIWRLQRSQQPSRLVWTLVVAFNSLGLGLLAITARYPTSLYFRNALFSEVYDDIQIPNEQALNAALAQRIRRDPPELDVRGLFSPAELALLDGYAVTSRTTACRVATDHPATRLTPTDCLARMLAKDVSPYQIGGKCGLDGSLRARIGLVRGGVGCCSDYNEAFLLRAQAVGMQAREVHNMGHTMSEYYDPADARWKWIDTSNRVQINHANGSLVSAWQRRIRLPWRELNFVDLPPVAQASSDSISTFRGYLATYNSVLYWTKGINLQQVEQFEAPLRQFGIPRELVQAISLSLGIRPGWFVLAPPEAAFRFRLSAWLLRISLAFFVLADGVLLAAALGWRLTRSRLAS